MAIVPLLVYCQMVSSRLERLKCAHSPLECQKWAHSQLVLAYKQINPRKPLGRLVITFRSFELLKRLIQNLCCKGLFFLPLKYLLNPRSSKFWSLWSWAVIKGSHKRSRGATIVPWCRRLIKHSIIQILLRGTFLQGLIPPWVRKFNYTKKSKLQA